MVVVVYITPAPTDLVYYPLCRMFFYYQNELYLFLYFRARTLNTLPLPEQGFPLKEQRQPDGSSIKLPFVAVEIVVVGVVAVTGQLYPLQGRDVVGQLYPRQGGGVVW